MADQATQLPDGFQPIGLSGANERLDQARKARQPYEADWYMNAAFFQGEQWVAWDGKGLYRPRLKRSRVILTDNRVQPIIRTEVARLTKARPGWTAVPRSLDDDAVSSAQATVRLLEWSYDHLDMASHRREAVTWSRITGAGFIKTTWDPSVGIGTEVLVNAADGKAIPNPKTGRPVRVGEMPEIEKIDGVQTKAIGKGEVDYCVRSPFDIFPDPLATNLADARWIIDEAVRSPEYVKDRYGKVVPPDAAAQVGVVESRMAGGNIEAGGEKLGVRVFEMWEPPSVGNPHGRRVAWVKGTLLYEGPNEYGRIPYVMFPGIIVPGRFWPDAVTTHLRPIQARWNKLISQVAENISKTANPSLLLDKLIGIEFSGVPGEQIKHNATSQTQLPQYLSPPSMPGYVFNFMEQMQGSFREISGQYEVSNGTVPPGVTAASAISLLQEQDSTRLGPDVEALEVALGSVGQQTVEIQGRYYTTDRIVVVVGEDGIVDADTFRADITYQVPNVSVQAFSTFPRSQAAKQAAIRDMLNMFLQYGVPLDAGALTYALRDMQVGGLERLVSTYTADTNQVAREHVEFLRGKELHVREVDNHQVHIVGHKDFAKGPRFLALPDGDQARLIKHIHDHEAAAGAGAQMPPGLPAPPPGAIPTQPSGNPMPDLNQAPPEAGSTGS